MPMDAKVVVDRCLRGFAARFGGMPELGVLSPGRVNLIGDHTDYNEGFVLPMAIDRWTVIAACRRPDGVVRVGTTLGGDIVRLGHGEPDPDWAKYVRGTLELCEQAGLAVGGLDIWIDSSVPTGAGLSSSAALCVGVATLAECICGIQLGVIEKARLCQRVEHVYAGVPCGIMDQLVIAGASPGSAMLLDCRSLTAAQVPIDPAEVAVLIADTGVSRTLAGSVYAQRREECERAAGLLGVASLRDVSAVPTGQDAPLLRARHVVTENARVPAMSEALMACDWASAGLLMTQSHASLRDDFGITGQALDAMVECAEGIEGVYGARMTGAGMGGCAVVLARADGAAVVAGELTARYRERTPGAASVFEVRAVSGAAPFDPRTLTG